jgi:hypothetical protein
LAQVKETYQNMPIKHFLRIEEPCGCRMKVGYTLEAWIKLKELELVEFHFLRMKKKNFVNLFSSNQRLVQRSLIRDSVDKFQRVYGI